jgi:hypothetical protein
MKLLFVETANDQNPGVILRLLVQKLVDAVAKEEWGNDLPNFIPLSLQAMQNAAGIEVKYNAHNNNGNLKYNYDEVTKAADLAAFKAAYGQLTQVVLNKINGAEDKIVFTYFGYVPAHSLSVNTLLSVIDQNNEGIGIMIERNDGVLDFNDFQQVGEMSSENMANFFKEVTNNGGNAVVPPKAAMPPVGAWDMKPAVQPAQWEVALEKEIAAPQPDDVKTQLLKAIQAQKKGQQDPNLLPIPVGLEPAVEPPKYEPPKENKDAILGALAKALQAKRAEEDKIAARKALENPKSQEAIRKRLVGAMEDKRKKEEAVRQQKLAPIKDQLAEAMKMQEELLVGSPIFDNQVPAFQQAEGENQEPAFHGLVFNAGEVDENDADVKAAKAILEGLNNPVAEKKVAGKPKKKSEAADKAIAGAEALLGKLYGG